MRDEDLTKPIELDKGAKPEIDREAVTRPVNSSAVVTHASEGVISPEPAFRAADAEDTGQIVLPEELSGKRPAAPIASPTFPEADPAETALFLGAFFQELARCGVKDFVVSPGSRSTGLAMIAFETVGEVYVDVDERSAAFFALGLAKATGNPVGVICTSGTAPANWMPAVLEAEASRVPVLFLSADRPPRLQKIAAHQTTDQQDLFAGHVKAFYQMPLPAGDDKTVTYARQVALDAAIAAHGAMPGARSCDGGPVHVNFPLEEPLKPALLEEVRPRLERVGAARTLPPTVVPGQVLLPNDTAGLLRVIAGKRVVALCGEGSANSASDVEALVEFAQKRNVPLLADPLSGLRCSDASCVMSNYDSVFGHSVAPMPEVVVRFGRWPVSKRCAEALGSCGATQLVVDMRDTRDAMATTTTFVRTTPVAFARALAAAEGEAAADRDFFESWAAIDEKAGERIGQVGTLIDMDSFEGTYVDALFDMVPADSLVYAASSMSIRAIDTFYRANGRPIEVLCNRGLSGIDGTLSSAIGAACAYEQTTVLAGDLAFLHDANALSLQWELRTREHRGAGVRPSIVIAVLNNNGGGIFDLLPQRSSEDYFERLFLTPQRFHIKELAAAFEVSYRKATTVAGFRRAYTDFLGTPGISIIDIEVPLGGMRERYERFW